MSKTIDNEKRYYAPKDRLGGFLDIYSAPNDAHAKRIFELLRTDDKTFFGKFPNDFSLYYIGCLNETTGIFTSELYQIPDNDLPTANEV